MAVTIKFTIYVLRREALRYVRTNIPENYDASIFRIGFLPQWTR
jgi:hypothetical protein